MDMIIVASLILLAVVIGAAYKGLKNKQQADSALRRRAVFNSHEQITFTRLKEILPEIQKMKREIVATREPGGVRVAEEIRQIILDPKNTEIDSKTELMLFAAARRLHMQEKMLPALQAGKIVIVDRFIDSSVAYQGYGRDLGVEVVDWLNYFATDGLKPDLTLYFDVDTDRAVKDFQKKNKLVVDGIVGIKTWTILLSAQQEIFSKKMSHMIPSEMINIVLKNELIKDLSGEITVEVEGEKHA